VEKWNIVWDKKRERERVYFVFVVSLYDGVLIAKCSMLFA
jgi:hypothetical protein